MRAVPSGQTRWVKENGNCRLTIAAGDVYDRKTRSYAPMLPYGKVARAGLLYINSEVHRTGERVVSLGASQRQFMRKLGFEWGGADARRIQQQMEALAKSQVTLSRLFEVEKGVVEQYISTTVASAAQLWFPAKIDEEGQEGLFESSIVVAPGMMDFFKNAMPVDLRACYYLNKTSKSPLVLDVYQWLAERAHRAPTEGVLISWEQLRDQFSPDATALRSFKQSFSKALDVVLPVYPARVERESTGIRLRYTKPQCWGPPVGSSTSRGASIPVRKRMGEGVDYCLDG